jgi:hypothetical protein
MERLLQIWDDVEDWLRVGLLAVPGLRNRLR